MTDGDPPASPSVETYVIAAGGTGGHVFPGIAFAREIVARRPGARVVFVGSTHGLEGRLVPAAGFALETVTAAGFAGKSVGERFLALARVPKGFHEARRLLTRLRPKAVAGVGGYVSVPVILAARGLGIPTLIHESNAMPGIANRFLNRVATRTAVGIDAARARLSRPAITTGTPVRPEFFAIGTQNPGGRGRILVFGGSQGSAALNRAAVEAAPELASDGLEAIHQTGERWLDSVRSAYGTPPAGWRIEPFLPRLYEEMAWADLIVCRAGALTLAELAAAGRPAVLVPLPTSTHGHQLQNARSAAEAGAAIVLEEKGLTGAALGGVVRSIFADRRRLAAMGERSRRLARPDAARRLADLLFEIAGGPA